MVITRFAHQFASEVDHRLDVLVAHCGGLIESPFERLVVMTGGFQIHTDVDLAHENVPRVCMVRAIRDFPFDIRSPARRQSATWKSAVVGVTRFAATFS